MVCVQYDVETVAECECAEDTYDHLVSGADALPERVSDDDHAGDEKSPGEQIGALEDQHEVQTVAECECAEGARDRFLFLEESGEAEGQEYENQEYERRHPLYFSSVQAKGDCL